MTDQPPDQESRRATRQGGTLKTAESVETLVLNSEPVKRFSRPVAVRMLANAIFDNLIQSLESKSDFKNRCQRTREDARRKGAQ